MLLFFLLKKNKKRKERGEYYSFGLYQEHTASIEHMATKLANKEKTNTNKKEFKVIPLKDQPLSSYPWIAYQKGYNTLEEVASHFNIELAALKKMEKETSRKRKKVITGIVKTLCSKTLMYEGQRITNTDLIEMTGFSKSVIEKRVQRGWDVERIINTPVRGKVTYTYEVDGIIYTSMIALSQAFDINWKTVRARMANGMTAEEAVKTPVRESNNGKDRQIYCLGKIYDSISFLCREKGINESTLCSYIACHSNEALDGVVLRMMNEPMYQYMVYNKGFKTIADISREYDVKYDTLCHYMNKGKFETIEQILEFLKKTN